MLLWILIAVILLAFCTVLTVRTLRFTPPTPTRISTDAVQVDGARAAESLAAMLQCKTIASIDPAQTDHTEYQAFEAVLLDRYPLVHANLIRTKHGETGLLYHLKGETSDAPAVLMAHYDVVPAEESLWTRPAFDGLREDGYIWGRGALDTKSTLCGILEALEQLLGAGYRPKNDLYLSFSGDEEVSGESCPAIVRYLEEQGITPAFVLDEGGAVVDHVFPGVAESCALVGIGEKGGLNVELAIAGSGGHASTPPPHTLAGRIARAVTRIEETPFPRQLTPPVVQMFDTLGRHSSFFYRMLFANLWCFAPLLDLICKKKGGELNALLRTTNAVTQLTGSKAYNVLPARATCGINLRLLGTDTVDRATARLAEVVADDEITIRVVDGMNPSPVSETTGTAWETLSAAIRATFTDAILSPYLMLACSDARHYARISSYVYRFSPMHLSKAERETIHGNDERIAEETLTTVVKFYLRLMQML